MIALSPALLRQSVNQQMRIQRKATQLILQANSIYERRRRTWSTFLWERNERLWFCSCWCLLSGEPRRLLARLSQANFFFSLKILAKRLIGKVITNLKHSLYKRAFQYFGGGSFWGYISVNVGGLNLFCHDHALFPTNLVRQEQKALFGTRRHKPMRV